MTELENIFDSLCTRLGSRRSTATCLNRAHSLSLYSVEALPVIVTGIKTHHLKEHLTWCFKGPDLAQEVTSAMEKLTAYSNNRRIRNSHHPSSH